MSLSIEKLNKLGFKDEKSFYKHYFYLYSIFESKEKKSGLNKIKKIKKDGIIDIDMLKCYSEDFAKLFVFYGTDSFCYYENDIKMSNYFCSIGMYFYLFILGLYFFGNEEKRLKLFQKHFFNYSEHYHHSCHTFSQHQFTIKVLCDYPLIMDAFLNYNKNYEYNYFVYRKFSNYNAYLELNEKNLKYILEFLKGNLPRMKEYMEINIFDNLENIRHFYHNESHLELLLIYSDSWTSFSKRSYRLTRNNFKFKKEIDYMMEWHNLFVKIEKLEYDEKDQEKMTKIWLKKNYFQLEFDSFVSLFQVKIKNELTRNVIGIMHDYYSLIIRRLNFSFNSILQKYGIEMPRKLI